MAGGSERRAVVTNNLQRSDATAGLWVYGAPSQLIGCAKFAFKHVGRIAASMNAGPLSLSGDDSG